MKCYKIGQVLSIFITIVLWECNSYGSYSNCLLKGDKLYTGQCLYSSDGATFLCYTSNGNFTATHSGTVYWNILTSNAYFGPGYALMGYDGGFSLFSLYTSKGTQYGTQQYWTTGTSSAVNIPSFFMLQSSGNIVLFYNTSYSRILYQSYTAKFTSVSNEKCVPFPTSIPTPQPTPSPTSQPTGKPSHRPSSQPISKPSGQPSSQPSRQPLSQPSSQPTRHPSRQPTRQPNSQPSGQPTNRPYPIPSTQPSAKPSMLPTSQPTRFPSGQPSLQPMGQPTRQPSSQPSKQPLIPPTVKPTLVPSMHPTRQPSFQPTIHPSNQPSRQPSMQPSMQPSIQPIKQPSSQPTSQPTTQPSSLPTSQPSYQPSQQPSHQPSHRPSCQPFRRPSAQPTRQPTSQPSIQPIRRPSSQPSFQPFLQPTSQPSFQPVRTPSSQPTSRPSRLPTSQPSQQPRMQPTRQPSSHPSAQPSRQPTSQPTSQPSPQPSQQPSGQPTGQPSSQPTRIPSQQPKSQPSNQPSIQPTCQPSSQPSTQSTCQPSGRPSTQPTFEPSCQPSYHPSCQPSSHPSGQPTVQPSSQPTAQPTFQPIKQPTSQPTRQPTVQPTRQPTSQPTCQPTAQPTSQPSAVPTKQPTRQPSSHPSFKPTKSPSGQPSYNPTKQPTTQPSVQPSRQPTIQPSRRPSGKPSKFPSAQPSCKPSRRPSSQPSREPTRQPNGNPSNHPTSKPSNQPSEQPTRRPFTSPTRQPFSAPTSQPSSQPLNVPTVKPVAHPSGQPSQNPTLQPFSQPSVQPTIRPSLQPLSRPTARPSRMPSRQPSQQPIAQPTNQPSRQPTIQPTRQPTKQPAKQPTDQPSCHPTIQPTKQPISKPSSQPSRRPSKQPSQQPTIQPSQAPSTLPSMQPSALPTSDPSTQPTCLPSSEPSSQPTEAPSQYPTSPPTSEPTCSPSSYPTALPSPMPSAHPTALPSSLPTNKPTEAPLVVPSARPSTHPRTEPTFIPTTQPSQQPAKQPTRQPSRIPTMQPSSEPSRNPSIEPNSRPTKQPLSRPTHRPSRQPAGRPSSQPYGKPSVRPSARPTSPPTEIPSAIPSSLPTYLSSSHPTQCPTSQPSGGPTSRPNGQPSEQPTRQPSRQPSHRPSYSPLGQPTVQPSSQPSRRPSRTPSRQPSRQPYGRPSAIPSNSPVGQPTTAPTQEPTSRPTTQPSIQPSRTPSSHPSTQPASQPSTQPTCQPSRQPSIQPNNRPTARPSSHPSGIPSRQPTVQPSRHPSHVPTQQPWSHPSSRPSLLPSTVSPTARPTSIPSVQPMGLPSSQPSIMPTFYPSSQPSNEPSSEPTARLQNSGIVFLDAAVKVVSSSIPVLSLVSVSLTLPPLQYMTVSVDLVCSSSTIHDQNSLASFEDDRSLLTPQNVTFRSSSKSISASFDFIGFGSPGMCALTGSLFGPSAKFYTLVVPTPATVAITATDQSPPPPTFMAALFSNDGASVLLQFNAATSGVELFGVQVFACSELFVFTTAAGVQRSTVLILCQWAIDGASVTATLGPGSKVAVGDSVTLSVGNNLRAYCPTTPSTAECQSWPSTSTRTLTIGAPRIPPVPVVLLLVPTTVSQCADLALDWLQSQGSCGRAWTNHTVTVSSSTQPNVAAAVQSIISVSEQPSGLPAVVPASILQSGIKASAGYSLTISVRLCNFLGACGSSTVSVSVISALVPSVTLAGSFQMSTTRARVLSLSSFASTPSCNGSVPLKSSTLNLKYSWSVFQGDQSGVRVTVNSASTDPTALVLSAYILQASTTYTVTLVVTNTVSRLSATASKVVVVAAGVLVPIVRGGSLQTVQLGSPFSLDGSSSYDSDQPSRGRVGMLFSWSCVQRSPVYSTRCNIFNSSSPTAMSSSACSGAAAVDAASSSYSVSLTVYDSTRSAIIVTTLVMVGAGAPIVAIQSKYSTVSAAINPASSLQLVGTVSMPGPGVLTWSVDDPSISLQYVAVTPIQQTVSAATPAVTVNLVVSPNSLPQRTTLTFTLTAKLQDSTISSNPSSSSSSSLQSFASVSLAMNGAPLPGLLTVSPLTGLALSTDFKFAAPSWVDSDIPLSYQFGLLTGRGVLLVLQSQSQAAGGHSMLPAGSISLVSQIYDVYGANSSAFVKVNSRSASFANQSIVGAALANLMQTLQSVATSNIDTQKRLISLAVATVNTVDCSAVPATCAAINRLLCTTTPNTCGPCVDYSLYLGEVGDSNAACLPLPSVAARATGRRLTGSICKVSSQCGAWEACNQVTHVCEVIGKQCPSACSGHGSCSYVSSLTGLAVDFCTVINSGCSAVCSCYQGYYGSSCSLTSVELVSLQAVRTQLLVSLQTVVGSEFPSQAAVESWAAALAAITTDPLQLSPPAQAAVVSTAKSILASAVSSSLPLVSLYSLLAVVDSSARALQSRPSISTSQGKLLLNNQHRQLALASSPATAQSVRELIDTMNVFALSRMMPGQVPSTSIQSVYRTVNALPSSSSLGRSGTTVISMTQSSMERLTGQSMTQVAITGMSPFTNVSLSALNAALFWTGFGPSTSAVGTALAPSQQLSSTILRLQFQTVGFISTAAAAANHTVQVFIFIPLDEAAQEKVIFAASPHWNRSYVTDCRLGTPQTYSYACYYAPNITVRCSGEFTQSIVSRCPVKTTQPSCISSGAGYKACQVVTANISMTVCACNICLSPVGCRNTVVSPQAHLNLAAAPSTALPALTATVTLEVVTAMTATTQTFPSALLYVGDFDIPLSAELEGVYVIGTFAALWLGFLLVSVLVDGGVLGSRSGRSRVTHMLLKHELPRLLSGKSVLHKVHDADLGSATVTSSTCSTHDDMREYLALLFPLVFDSGSTFQKLLKSMSRNHIVVSAILHENGLRKYYKILRILSNLTANLFFLAVFFDSHWPSDTGRCQECEDDKACCVDMKSSVFGPPQPLCSWSPATFSTFNATDVYHGTKHTCQWIKPTYNSYTIIGIFIVVMIISGPVHAVLDALTATAMGSTLSDQQVMVRKGQQQLQEPQQLQTSNHDHHSTGDGSTGTEASPATVSGNRLLCQPWAMKVHMTHKINQDIVTKRNCVQLKYQAGINVNFHHFITTTNECDDSEPIIDPPMDYDSEILKLQSEVKCHVSSMPRSERKPFRRYWATVSSIAVDDGDADTTTAPTFPKEKPKKMKSPLELLRLELEYVRKKAAASQRELNQEQEQQLLADLPAQHAMAGTHLLSLLIDDIVGRGTKISKLLQTHTLFPVRRTAWVPSAGRSFMLVALLVVNCSFVLASIAYSQGKELDWQQAWVGVAITSILLETLVLETSTVATIYVAIPALVADTLSQVRDQLEKCMDEFKTKRDNCIDRGDNETNETKMPKFSVANYFFASGIVAKSYPHLIESQLVLSYTGEFVSDAQKSRWEHPQGRYIDHPLLPRGAWDQVSIWASLRSLAINFGAQSILVQKLLLRSVVSPLLLSVIAYFGCALLQGSLAGIPLGLALCVLTVAGIISLGRLWVQQRKDKRTKSKVAPSSTTTPTSPGSMPGPGPGPGLVSIIGEKESPHARETEHTHRAIVEGGGNTHRAVVDDSPSQLQEIVQVNIQVAQPPHAQSDAGIDVATSIKLPLESDSESATARLEPLAAARLIHREVARLHAISSEDKSYSGGDKSNSGGDSYSMVGSDLMPIDLDASSNVSVELPQNPGSERSRDEGSIMQYRDSEPQPTHKFRTLDKVSVSKPSNNFYKTHDKADFPVSYKHEHEYECMNRVSSPPIRLDSAQSMRRAVPPLRPPNSPPHTLIGSAGASISRATSPPIRIDSAALPFKRMRTPKQQTDSGPQPLSSNAPAPVITPATLISTQREALRLKQSLALSQHHEFDALDVSGICGDDWLGLAVSNPSSAGHSDRHDGDDVSSRGSLASLSSGGSRPQTDVFVRLGDRLDLEDRADDEDPVAVLILRRALLEQQQDLQGLSVDGSSVARDFGFFDDGEFESDTFVSMTCDDVALNDDQDSWISEQVPRR